MTHEKTFEAIAKLKDIEVELHRLKNALEMANKVNTYKPDQKDLAAGLIQELFDVVAKYDDAIMMSTVLGVLETMKFDLIHRQHHELEAKMSAMGQA